MKYYNEIKNKLIDNEVYSKVKDYSKERYKVITYYEIGKLLNEAGGIYGDNIIAEYSKKLINEVDKKYNSTNLKRMRQFYLMIEKGALMGQQLSWSHYKELIPLKDPNAIIIIFKENDKSYHLGYVPRYYCKELLDELRKGTQYSAMIQSLNLESQLSDENITSNVKLILNI